MPPTDTTALGSKTDETRHFRPLLAPDLEGDVITFDALHFVKASIAWLAETKNAHHVAVIKPNQPTARAQSDSSTGTTGQHTASNAGHGCREPHSIETLAMADNLAGTAFPHGELALFVHRRR